jgi:hypothetical protein
VLSVDAMAHMRNRCSSSFPKVATSKGFEQRY